MKFVLGKGVTKICTLLGESFKCYNFKCNGFTTDKPTELLITFINSLTSEDDLKWIEICVGK
jgi:hypothetical protein